MAAGSPPPSSRRERGSARHRLSPYARSRRSASAHRRRLKGGHTVFTNLLTGGLARGLRGRLVDELGPVRGEAAALSARQRRARADPRGGRKAAANMASGRCGPGKPRRSANALPAAELTRKLAADALAILRAQSLEHGQWKSSRSRRSATITCGSSTTRRAARRRWSIRAMPRRCSPKRSAAAGPSTQVWNTHWHPDHTGGNLAIKEATGARISGPGEREYSRPRRRACRKATKSVSATTSGG